MATTSSRPAWFDGRMPVAADCSVGLRLDRALMERPGRVFALFEDGATWTCAETAAQVRKTAGALRALGVKRATTCSTGCRTARRCCAPGSRSTISAPSTCR